jgi:hypothetical protein
MVAHLHLHAGRLAPAGLRPERGASVAKTIAELGLFGKNDNMDFLIITFDVKL